jgi:hypothetical protein
MIAHIVLFQPKGDLSPERRQQVLAAIAQVVERCPSVRTCRVGRRVRHGLPGYEQAMARDYAYALVLEFDDVSGLREYLVHPAHQALGEMFTAGADAALAYDYELTPLDEARHAL